MSPDDTTELCYQEREVQRATSDSISETPTPAVDPTPHFRTTLFSRETHIAARCYHRNRRSCDRAHRPAPPLMARGDVAKRRERALHRTAKTDRRDWRQLVTEQVDEVLETMDCMLPNSARFIATVG
jgi:hypothetical protein